MISLVEDTFRESRSIKDASKIVGNAEKSSGRSMNNVADDVFDKICATASGTPTISEQLGHREFILTYKTFEPAGPNCLPSNW